ncbi:MAG: carbohydrate porin [Oligoflexus sp.]
MLLRLRILIMLFPLSSSLLLAETDHKTQFIGYFRSTLGISDRPGLPGFGAPGIPAKYRLGNEADTVLELGVDHRFADGPDAPAGSYLQGVFMLSSYAPIGGSQYLNELGIAQAYVKMSRYLGDFDVWLGRRYYQRQQLELNDYYWLNPGQGSHLGAGLEDLPLAAGRLDLALLTYEDQAVASQIDEEVSANLHSRQVELRYRDIQLTKQISLSSLLSFSHRPKDELLAYPEAEGKTAALWLNMQFGRHAHSLATIMRQGLGLVQSPTNGKPIRENSIASGYDLKKASLYELSHAYTYYGEALTLQFLAIHHQEATGRTGVQGDRLRWNSLGIRPVYFIHRFISLAGELGYDDVRNDISGHQGGLTKATLALQLMKDTSAGARPTIRFFVTHANWSRDFQGMVGSLYEQDKTQGWSSGLQTEVWW